MGKNDATPLGEQYDSIAYAMDHHLKGKMLPTFHTRFYAVKCDSGRIIVEEDREDPDVVKIVDLEEVERAVATYVRDHLRMSMEFDGYEKWTPAHIKAAVRHWWLVTEPIPEPKAFLWQGERDIKGFRRLPWDLRLGPTPTWDKLLARTKNVNALKQFIGSLFFPESNCQQYVWIYGPGGDGKGSMNRFFARVFGRAYHSGSPPVKDKEANWVYYILIGKRLVVFPDCDNPDFVADGFFKSITGGDPVAAEKKYGEMFTFTPSAKYLVLSNVKPNLTGERSNMRRIIYVEMTEEKGVEVGFEDSLWNEGGSFLASCMQAYRENNPEPALPIKTEDEAIQEWVGEVEEEYEVAFSRAFGLSPSSYVTANDMDDFLRAWFAGSKKRRDTFRAWLKRKHGISGVRRYAKMTKKQIRIYEGLYLLHENGAISRSMDDLA